MIWLLCCVVAVWAESDPYKALGLDRSATAEQIKKAYNQKAVQHHPDKNPDDPSANAKFIEINNAYGILKDPERKRNYDLYGTTEQQQPAQNSPPWSYQRRYVDYYSQSSYKDSISFKLTHDTYQKVTGAGSDPSQVRVWLIFVFSDFGCQLCQKVSPLWEEAAKQLQGYVHTAKLNSDFEASIVNKLGVRTVPSIIAVTTVKGKSQVKSFSTSSWFLKSAEPIVDFASQQLEPLTIIKGATLVELRKSWKAFEEAATGGKGGGWWGGGGAGGGERKLLFLILARKPTPHVMWHWHATRLKAHAKFAYLSTSSLSQGVVEELGSLFRLSSHAEEHRLSSRVHPMILVRRDMGYDSLLAELPADRSQLHELLQRQKLVIPKVSAANFYETCFVGKRCLLFLQQSHPPQLQQQTQQQTQHQQEQRSLLQLLPPELGLGWVSLREQAGFAAFFKDKEGRIPTALLLDTEDHRFAAFWQPTPTTSTSSSSSSSSATASSAITTEQQLANFVQWVTHDASFKDATQMPFLEEPSSLSSSMADLFDVDLITPSLLLITLCVLLGSVVLLIRL